MQGRPTSERQPWSQAADGAREEADWQANQTTGVDTHTRRPTASHKASAHPTKQMEGLRQPGTGRNSRNTNANQTSQMTGMGTHDLSPTSGQQCAHLRHKETTQGGGKLASHCELSNVTQGARGSTSSTSNASHKATAHPTKRMVRLRSPPRNHLAKVPYPMWFQRVPTGWQQVPKYKSQATRWPPEPSRHLFSDECPT